jgi:hypothetical protein
MNLYKKNMDNLKIRIQKYKNRSLKIKLILKKKFISNISNLVLVILKNYVYIANLFKIMLLFLYIILFVLALI